MRKVALAGLSLLLAGASGPLHAERAQVHFDRLLAAFTSGDAAAIKAFCGTHLQDSDAPTARNVREETCGFDLASIEAESQATFSALLTQRCFSRPLPALVLRLP